MGFMDRWNKPSQQVLDLNDARMTNSAASNTLEMNKGITEWYEQKLKDDLEKKMQDLQNEKNKPSLFDWISAGAQGGKGIVDLLGNKNKGANKSGSIPELDSLLNGTDTSLWGSF